MPSAGRQLYEQRCPYSRAWEDLTAVDRRWWAQQAQRMSERPTLTWPQRLVCWALGVTVCGGAVAGLVGLVGYMVSRW